MGASVAAWTAPARLRRLVSADHLVWVALALIWVLDHPYIGIEHDARIYMGRVQADLDPAGVGRDMMFALDGQSAFTIFRVVSRTLVAAMGLGPAVGLLTFINLAAWFAAIVCLARVLIPGRVLVLVLLIALVLPRFYAPWHLFGAGESVPVPRPLAEAGVLLALAAFHQSRMWRGLACLIGAALLHPIMAAPGFAVLFVLLVRADRSWLFVAALALACTAVAAALGAPIVSRLLVGVDPGWRAILVERTPYLWLRLWPASTFGMITVQAATILVASMLLERRGALLLLAVLATGLFGGLASLALADGLSSLLAVQAQFWRAFWLVAALAPLAAGICAWRLPARGGAGQVAAALLALAWFTIEWMPLGPIAVLAALACVWLGRRRPDLFGHRSVVAVAIACAAMIVVAEAIPVSAVVEIMAARPQGAALPWTVVSRTGVMAVPIVILALTWWRFRQTTAARVGMGVAVAALAGLVAFVWDSRPAFQVAADGGRRKPDLQAMLAARPGEVLWLRHDEVWGWLGRANWTGETQGASIVFSRALATDWHDRSRAVVAHGMARHKLLAPWSPGDTTEAIDLGRADVSGFCRRRDAPAWIVTPIEAGHAAPSIADLAVWSPGIVDWTLATGTDGFRWVGIDRFGVIPCGDTRPTG